MTRWAAFGLGMAVGVAAAILTTRASPSAAPDVAPAARARMAAEGELAAARAQVANLTRQLEALTARYNVLAAQFDEMARRAASSAPSSATKAPEPSASPEFQSVAEEEWQALVSGALQSEIERRFGQTLPPERQQRLVDALARVRAAAALMNVEGGDAHDPAPERRQLTRSIILLEADRVFREETGLGVAEFLRGLDADQVEDVPANDLGEHDR